MTHPRLRLVPAPAPSDLALVRRFVGGDRAAFGQLFEHHREAVFAVLRRAGHSPSETADLVQRAFLRALVGLEASVSRLDETQFSFRPWVLRIALNLAKNHRRDGARWAPASLEALDQARSAEPSAEQQLERAEQRARTRAAVLHLPNRQREVFTLRVDAALSFAEVAAVLGITESNAKTNFHLAVKHLRAVMQAGADDAL